jgi:hypothetical protein
MLLPSLSSVNRLSKKSLITLGLIVIMVFVVILPSVTFAEGGIPTEMLKKTGIGATLGGENVDLLTVIGNIVKFVLRFLAVVFVILIIYSGFKWMTAGGDSKKVDEAKSVMKNAIIGLIIVMCSYAIATVVFNVINTQILKGGAAGGATTVGGTKQ